ncbi:CDP-glycerol glycerophosphotransferase family protein [Enterococcus phoeniculicola]|jgi:CDP-glycerol glycerophosphotransferase (TagB/SpsB family)|uniref:Uncharacterized protein n=1 Tax=Enterococcus phoeniculicola ATCC BAA-412 TaxID=1158610 RepID=R3WMC1_9ENTE|nr:CDP-glycerol glycerophosphotransferase family protein [Enterococcus phoeniculicola]EOL48971.1 hypothetical protein UC3_00524 [Enterococcus phoeniculicola ATCC BAA-412]EOT72817.1 hypothetical protein I589_03088 [Enterococcus phoeniculicola ATCC BAA-412]
MKIAIVGYNIFGVGGTSRSNINLVKELTRAGAELTVFNITDFTNEDVTDLITREEMSTKIIFSPLNEIFSIVEQDVYILTRESLFLLSKAIKSNFPKSKVIGEVHAPLERLKFEETFYQDSIDVFRVATESIKESFKKIIGKENVVQYPVSIEHIKYQQKIDNEVVASNNLVIYSRFDEEQKDISYAIQLIHYLVNTLKIYQFKLYIKGAGPGATLYRNLIRYYNIQNYVRINYDLPSDYIYLSTARFETFGYSIMEAFAEGRRVLMYEGDDNVLPEIYGDYETIGWLTKDIERDAKYILDYISKVRTNDEYLRDVQRAKKYSVVEDYGKNYLMKVVNSPYSSNYVGQDDDRELVQEIYKLHGRIESSLSTKFYGKLKRTKGIRKILKNTKIQKIMRSYYNKKNGSESVLSEMNLRDDFVFVESFHGKNFSGDPKYLALALKNKYPNLNIFVSSINQLVDMEIYSFGCIPLRTGSRLYTTRFKQSRCVILNGNSLDKVGKNEQQIFVETWHGFPLKKMVSDLEDEKQREEETEAFIPRMLKWSYLLSSSEKNTKYIQSAFSLSKNEDLEILETGVPRNTYLLLNKDNVEEIQRVHFKYFNKKEKEKKYVLYCPTWRKDSRDNISTLDLIKLINLLPKSYELIVKLHPHESHLRKQYAQLSSRIHCFYNELVDIQELYLISSLLITDYSSAMFDFAHLNRKIIIFQEDAEAYASKIGWYFDLENLIGISGANYSEKKLAEEIIRPYDEFSTELITKNLMTDDSVESTNEIINILSKKVSWE